MSNDVNATGMSGMNGLLLASTRPPLITAVRPGLPSLKATPPVAPAALAFSTLHPVVAPATLDQRALAWGEVAEVGRGAAARRARGLGRRKHEPAGRLNRSCRKSPQRDAVRRGTFRP